MLNYYYENKDSTDSKVAETSNSIKISKVFRIKHNHSQSITYGIINRSKDYILKAIFEQKDKIDIAEESKEEQGWSLPSPNMLFQPQTCTCKVGPNNSISYLGAWMTIPGEDKLYLKHSLKIGKYKLKTKE